jgi:hypothetical protein
MPYEAARASGALSRALLLILAAEAACYAVLVRHLGPGPGVALAAGIALLLRTAPILLAYAIAAMHASPVPPQQRVGLRAQLGFVLQEIGTAALLYTVLQPFARLAMRGESAAGDRTPVLLVPGYLCNRAVWWSLRRWLRARGHPVFTLDLEPVFGDIDAYAGQIAQRIEAICRDSAAARIILIGGSMGGLAVRAYLRSFGAARVQRVVTLGAPHHGSVLARLAPGRNGRQMRPDSEWLAALAAAEGGRFAVPFASVYSCHDDLVAPQASSRLEGADNRPLPGVGHLSLAFSGRVRAELAQLL